MEALHVIPSSSITSLKNDEQEDQRGSLKGRGYSVNAPTARRLLDSHVLYQSCRKGFTNNTNEWDGLPDHLSSPSKLLGNAYPVPLSSIFCVTSSADRNVGILKEENTAVKDSRKKGTKMEKQKRDPSGSNGLVEFKSSNGLSTAEPDCIKIIDDGLSELLNKCRLEVSLPELNSGGNISGPKFGKITDETSFLKTISSNSDTGNVLEDLVYSSPQKFDSDDHILHSSNAIHANPVRYSMSSGESQNMQCRSINLSDYPCETSVRSHLPYYPLMKSDDPCSSEMNDSLVLDSISLVSSSDESSTAKHDLELLNKDTADMGISETPFQSAIAETSNRSNTITGVIESDNHVGRMDFIGQNINGDQNLHNTGRRDQRFREVPKKPNTCNIHDVGTLNGRSGKENTHCIWRKVRKNDSDEYKCNSGSGNTACSDSNNMLKEALWEEKHCHSAHSYIVAESEEKKQTKPEAFRKLKRKKRPGKKRRNDSCFRVGISSVVTSSNVCLKNDTKQTVVFDSEAQADKSNDLDTYSHFHTRTGHHKIRFQDKKVESVISGLSQTSETYCGNLEVCQNSYIDQNAENQTISRSCNRHELQELDEVHLAVGFSAPLNDEGAKAIKEVSPADCSKRDAGSGAIPQTWMSIGSKDCRMPGLVPDRSPLRVFNEPAAKCLIPEKIVGDQLAFFNAPISSEKIKVMNDGQESESFNTLSSQDESLVQKLTDESHVTEESHGDNAARSCPKPETSNENASLTENVSSNILRAVNDAHRARFDSEMIEMRTGSPVAEFERLLCSASPAIYVMDYITRCQACMHHQAFDESLCGHDIPNISLGSLWKWYEKHGSYGLEVKAEDYDNPKRLGIDQFAFRAYFVPFLSAIQLFKDSKGQFLSRKNVVSGTMADKEYDRSKTAVNSSNIGLLPIFSLLVPQPRANSLSFSTPTNHIFDSGISCISTEDSESDSSCSDDMELLFEYFESEQPQWRRPLFEMIKELVGGDGPSKFRVYGDPAVLDTVGLPELHPNSWYSVAWYPIYRIPDGSFRAAFLTYHSLGHFIQRGPTSVSSFADSSCIVSPVVGLESYNAQSECWFRPRHPATCMPKELLDMDPAAVLKQRLRTLEHTASLMARAVVKKGSQTHVNKQPDYEFFLSRRRW